jgi:hypothetical protein
MSSSSLAERVDRLYAMHRGLDESANLDKIAPLYEAWKGQLHSLQARLAEVVRLVKTVERLDRQPPSAWAEALAAARHLLAKPFETLAGTYMTPQSHKLFDAERKTLEIELHQIKQDCLKTLENARKAANASLSFVLTTVRIYETCGLPVDKPFVRSLEVEFKHFWELISRQRLPEVRAWAQLKAKLAQAEERYALAAIPGLSQETAVVLFKVNSGAEVLLSDLTPDMLKELQQFPALLATISLRRAN